jgi:hypothetical protein
MAEQISEERHHLYQSQWWVRLAAISEKRESETPVDRQPVEKRQRQSGFSKALASLFPADHRSGLVSIFAKSN